MIINSDFLLFYYFTAIRYNQKNSNITSFFTNEGKIQIDNTGSNGIFNTNSSIFANQSNGLIQIGLVGSIDQRGILNTSTFHHTGDTIKIANTGSDGIDNRDTLMNAGVIVIQNIGGIGIFNGSDGVFTNSGTTNIDDTSNDGVENAGMFNNAVNATINIGQHDGDIRGIGIFNFGNSGAFTNSGTIAIDNTSGDGIQNRRDFNNAANANINIGQHGGNVDSDGISNSRSTSTFTNSGTINIDNTISNGLSNQGDFNNAINATLDIGQNNGNIDDNGIFNSGSSIAFTNNGDIKIDNTSSNGINNQGNFDNAVNAIINIGQNDGNIGLNGIFNEGSSTSFTNNGTIAIDNASNSGIRNSGDCSNTTNGSLKIGQNGGNVAADGLFNIGGQAFFTNSGTIEIENPTDSNSGGIVLIDGAQFTDTTGIIRLGLNQAFSQFAFGIVDGIFTGNDSTTIQCVGDFFIGSSSTVSGIGQLELEGDWVNRGTFTTDSSVVTILGTSQSIIGGSSPTTFFDLTINNSGDVVLENDVTVARQLSLEAGQVNLGDNDLTLGDDFELVTQVGTSALVTDGMGEVISNIANGASRIFPVGNNNYTPITIQNDGTSDEFSVQCLAEVLENGTNGSAFGTNLVNTTWRIEEATAGGTDATLTAQWTSTDELADFDRNNAFLSRYDGTDWDMDASTSASGSDPYTITRSNVTEFSPFAVGTAFEGGLDCFGSDLVLTSGTLVSGTYSTQQSIESTNLIEASSTVDFIAANVIELKVGFHAENGSIFSAVIEDCALTTADDEAIEQRTDRVTESTKRTRLPLLFPNPVGQ